MQPTETSLLLLLILLAAFPAVAALLYLWREYVSLPLQLRRMDRKHADNDRISDLEDELQGLRYKLEQPQREAEKEAKDEARARRLMDRALKLTQEYIPQVFAMMAGAASQRTHCPNPADPMEMLARIIAMQPDAEPEARGPFRAHGTTPGDEAEGYANEPSPEPA